MKKNKDPKYPFRQGIAKQPSEKRIEKVKGRKLADFHFMTAYATLPWNHYGFGPVFGFAFGPVIWKFFVPQFLEKIHLAHYPVKHVDHALDEKVPFKPEHLHIYMDFINVWIRPIAMLIKRFGIINGSKLGGEFLRYLTYSYNEAFKMYSTSMTTTYRPACDLPSIKRLRGADPHFMCVPSLHIAIVCLCFSFYRMLFERENFTQEEKDLWNKELFGRAVEIGETVLYIKQHSVNCIPAALYMMTRIAPELFNPSMAVEFINALFVNVDDVEEEDKKKIHEHIHFMYERLLLEGAMEDNWVTPVARWLDAYEPYTPFYA